MCSDTRSWSISGFGFLCGKTEEHLANRKQLKIICVPPLKLRAAVGMLAFPHTMEARRWPLFSAHQPIHLRSPTLPPHPLPSYFYPSLFPSDPQLFASFLFINSPSGEILCSWHVTSIKWQTKLSAVHLPDCSRCPRWASCRVSPLPSFSSPLENQVPVSFRYSSLVKESQTWEEIHNVIQPQLSPASKFFMRYLGQNNI